MDLTKTKYQWMYTSTDDHEFLHYIAEIADWDNDYWRVYDSQFSEDDGAPKEADFPWTAACGLNALFAAPGLLSRMGVLRCVACCNMIGLSQGTGAPVNDKTVTIIGTA